MTKAAFYFIVSVVASVLLAGCTSTAPYQQDRRTSTPAVQTKASQSSRPQQKEIKYVVKKGDTLAAIGRRFGVTSRQLQQRNGITNPRSLKIGTKLVIPLGKQRVPASATHRSDFIWPLKKVDVSSEFGTRNKRHKGIDLRAPRGTSIYASADGTVFFAGRKRGYGNVIIIKHADNVKTLYGHNHRNLINKGERVRQGEKIATIGSTGNATGNHVHFEYIRSGQRLNPRLYVDQ